ncbi:MAG: PSD1 and planctomycete cytochrome C domain-containing protein [Chthoniobacter sp.]|nr:PSD1 and planctomycete cytochrome C domain-containing protein [Chthoniobacter sp.]
MRAGPFAIATLAGLVAPALGAATAEPTAEETAFFESKIRPILADNCYQCHSLEKGKSKGGLTLDTRDGVLKGGEDGPAIKPGDPAASPLIKAVNYQDKDMQMPPSKDGGKLTDAQIAALTEWVKMGAPDPRKDAGKTRLTGLTDKARHHWAYQPVTKPTQPVVKNRGWCRTPVDTFILAKLEEKEMVPAPDASKEALLRRATYDLTGLPPSPQDVTNFVADESPQAFAKVVERLLASPAYGERWGRYWLDTARYADTIGGDGGNNGRMEYRMPYAWTYRDYVIKAFNDDKPYDQFIVEQLAADQVPDIASDDSRLAALGFLTVGERFRSMNDVINDRIDTMSKGFLGLTVSCARCHDHKFDPIPTKDYYALHGVFASTVEPTEHPVIAMPPLDQLTDFHGRLDLLEQDVRDSYYRALSDDTAKFRADSTGYLLVGRKKKDFNAADMKARLDLLKQRRLDPDLAQEVGKTVRSNDPVFAPFIALMEVDAADFAAQAPGVIARFTAAAAPVSNAKDRKPRPTVNPLVLAALKDARPQSLDDVSAIYNKLFASVQGRAPEFFKAAAAARSMPPAGFDAATAQLLSMPYDVAAGGVLNAEQFRDLANRSPRKFAGRAGLNSAKINELLLTPPGAPVRAMTIGDAPRPKDSPVLLRGQQETRGEIVPRRFLEVLSPAGAAPFSKEHSGRLDLAHCIANKANPLTARVLVNRVWMHHFGEGFVPTPDDLGTQSEPPSHPELLDYLAGYFMEKEWSIKQLHRVIMLSRVYQISSDSNRHYEGVDPQNRLLWRANIRRLDFEAMRDSLLAISGRLDSTVGGQPVNLTDEPYSYRRSVYGYIDRGNLPELMQSFDFSDPDMTNSRRTTSIVPQQALFLMNSPMAVDVARRVVARPEVAAARDDLARVIALYRVLFQRNPKPPEIQMALKFVGSETKTSQDGVYNIDPKLTARVAAKKAEGKKNASGTRAIQNEGDIVERKPLTPWETFTQALLFSNEAAYVN